MVFMQTIAFAQEKSWHKGDHSFAINMNPIFPYVGNLFSNTGTNDLYLTSAGLIFRKQYAENRAIRFSTNIEIDQYTRYNTVYEPYMRSKFSSDVSFLVGERQWRFYGGWQAGLGLSNLTETFEYQSPPSNASQRITHISNDALSLYFGGFFGAEYLITNYIFLGVEVNLTAYARFTGEAETEYDNYAYDTSGNLAITGTVTETTPKHFNYAISSTNPVIFRAGIRF
jgi:hypothetical protein